VHAGNVPVIYNPVTTHVSPQFHVVHDDQFTSVLRSASTLFDKFYQQLYDKAKWLHVNEQDSTSDDLYTFDDYWDAPPTSKQKTKKIKESQKNTACHTPLNPNRNVASSETLKTKLEKRELQQENGTLNVASKVEHGLPYGDPREPHRAVENIKYNLVQVNNYSVDLEH